MKYKNIASKTSRALSVGTKVLKVAAPAYRYRNEIGTAAKYAYKGAKFIKNHRDEIKQAAKVGREYLGGGGGGYSIPGIVVDATLGIAKRQGEKYLDKRLGKYKSYRMAKAGFDTAYDVGTGNYLGALNRGADLYSELDPNKKRAARISGGVHGATAVVGGVMSGNVLRSVEGGMQLASAVDPNRKRAARVQRVNEDFISPTANLIQNVSKANKQINKSQKY